MSQFTIKDEILWGQPLSLLRKWEFVMNTLWRFFKGYSKVRKNVSLKNIQNIIHYRLDDGHSFEIGVDFFNSKYLSLFIRIADNEEFEARINNIDQFTEEGIIRTIANILTYAEKVK